MAIGDDALAAGMDILTGNEDANTLDTETNKTRDYIAQRTSAVTAVAKGGTGATNAAAARTNLGLDSLLAAKLTKTQAEYGADFTYRDAAIANLDATKLGKGSDTMTGNLFLPNASPATSGYTVAYIDGTGRVSKGASSERYKKYISAIDPASLGDIFPDLHRFQMRQGEPGAWKYGWIAERVAENVDTEPFVVYNEQGAPDSIDFIALLIAQNAWLHQALDLVVQRVEALEGASHAGD